MWPRRLSLTAAPPLPRFTQTPSLASSGPLPGFSWGRALPYCTLSSETRQNHPTQTSATSPPHPALAHICIFDSYDQGLQTSDTPQTFAFLVA